ncbi:TetR/AcrR family transcriptional regulator [Gordonia westfalica]|uniref:Regulatory protein, tetR family n=1 Tax=Gordonia westfalica TaxID=158898 RepID=A0A1H2GQ95_9ACTN|nr:regulatory protein, tetR family [Gordonia westfalica]
MQTHEVDPAADAGLRPRRKRADAQRNVVALIDAARIVFARSGVDAPAKEITDAAGVGVGTLYRHFPKRSTLVVAVLEKEIDACADLAEELRDSLRPADALAGWVDRYIELVGTKRGLASALHSGIRPSVRWQTTSWIDSSRRWTRCWPQVPTTCGRTSARRCCCTGLPCCVSRCPGKGSTATGGWWMCSSTVCTSGPVARPTLLRDGERVVEGITAGDRVFPAP